MIRSRTRVVKRHLEGIVSKRRDMPYRHGRSREWLKIKKPASPAAKRIAHGSFDPRVRCYQGDLPFVVFRSPRQFQQMLRNFEHVGAVIAQGHVLSNLKAMSLLPWAV